jgi:hypothetical protein
LFWASRSLSIFSVSSAVQETKSPE